MMIIALLAPAVVLFGVFVAWPIVEVVRLSLFQTNFLTTQFIGLANYGDVFTNRLFLRAAANSIIYSLFLPVFVVGVALAIALLVMNERKGWHDITRLVFFVPELSAGIIIAQVWRWVFHINGPLNWMLGSNVAWWATGLTGIPAISVVVGVATFGGSVIVFLAAILGIDPELYDAAQIDGATRWQVKARIVVPLIAPQIAAMFLLGMIAAPQVFETIYALAPYEHTATLTFHIYREAFIFSNHGKAAAQAVLLLVALGGVTYAQRRIVAE